MGLGRLQRRGPISLLSDQLSAMRMATMRASERMSFVLEAVKSLSRSAATKKSRARMMRWMSTCLLFS